MSPLAARDPGAGRRDRRRPGGGRARTAGTWRSATSTRRRSSRTPSPASWPRRADRVVGLVLAPHYSRGSVGEYHARPRRRPRTGRAPATRHRPWHDEPAWLDAQAARVRGALGRLPAGSRCCSPPTACPSGCWRATPTPTSWGRRPPPSPAASGCEDWTGWALAWQSAGRTPEPWRGPDVLEVIRDAGRPGRPRACWCARRASCPTTWRSSTTSTSTPPRWPPRRAWPSPARPPSTTSPR